MVGWMGGCAEWDMYEWVNGLGYERRGRDGYDTSSPVPSQGKA